MAAARRRVQLPAADVVDAALSPPIETLRSLLGLDADTAPQAIHRARTSTRRLRSNLRSIAAVVEAPQELRAELAWLGDSLGAVRDADVLAARLVSATEAIPDGIRAGVAELRAAVTAQRAAAEERLRADVSSVRFGTFIHELDLLAKEGSSRTEPLDARSVMRPRWRALRDAVGALDTPPSDDGLHAVRIETKRLRYAAELFRPVGGARCRRCIRRATRLQEVLGAQHDAARAREWLIDRELMDATTAAALGWIAADATAQRDLGRESWRPTWRSLERPKARFW